MPVDPFVSQFFHLSEVTCHCGCGLAPHEEFLIKLDSLRNALGRAVIPTSVVRCAAYNMKVSGTGTTGPHVPNPKYPDKGAIDFICHTGLALDAVRNLPNIGWYRYGLAQSQKLPPEKRWIHVDNWTVAEGFPAPALWTYEP